MFKFFKILFDLEVMTKFLKLLVVVMIALFCVLQMQISEDGSQKYFRDLLYRFGFTKAALRELNKNDKIALIMISSLKQLSMKFCIGHYFDYFIS